MFALFVKKGKAREWQYAREFYFLRFAAGTLRLQARAGRDEPKALASFVYMAAKGPRLIAIFWPALI